MKRQLIQILALTAIFAVLAIPAAAQKGAIKTNTRILYHNGPVMHDTSDVYLIWYGNWAESYPGNTPETRSILTHFVSFLGSSPYFNINTTYPNGNGATPNGALIYGGDGQDGYSHGLTLSVADIRGIVAHQLDSGALPLDTAGIYVVLASSDVTNTMPDGSYCSPNAKPHHGSFEFMGSTVKYAFIGNAMRCLATNARQFIAPDRSHLPTPNDDIAADAMASMLGHALSVTVTSPFGTDGPFGGWYDKFGLENSAKCMWQFGETYTTANGARANMQLGQRHFLIQQNWVNDRKGYCALSLP